MTNEQIKDLALAHGFKLKEQPSGEVDLNPYVYGFARAIWRDSRPSCPKCGEVLDYFDGTYYDEDTFEEECCSCGAQLEIEVDLRIKFTASEVLDD